MIWTELSRIPLIVHLIAFKVVVFWIFFVWITARILRRGAEDGFLCSLYGRDSIGRFDSLVVPVLLMIATTVIFLVSPEGAGALTISDSVEYVMLARRLLSDGFMLLNLDGLAVPSRYSPWFPVLFVFPFYYLFSPEIGFGIYGVTLTAVATVLLSYILGYRIGSLWGGLCAALLVLTIPGFRYFGGHIMTDVPTACLWLMAALLFVSVIHRPARGLLLYICAGVYTAVLSSFRPLSVFLALPFLALLIRRREDRRWLKLIAFLVPIVGIGASHLFYNHHVYRSMWRNGYNLWLAVPYDYLSMTFSIDYLSSNLQTLLNHTGIVVLTLLALTYPQLQKVAVRTDRRTLMGISTLKPLLVFTFTVGLPLIAVHLLYFYSTSRFYLPVRILLTVIVGGLLGCLLNLLELKRNLAIALVGCVVGGAVVFAFMNHDPLPTEIKVVRQLREHVAPSSVVISGLNPAYLEMAVGEKTYVTIVPVSRRVEFASKVLTWKKTSELSTSPEGPFDHRAKGLLNAGAVEVYPRVAVESVRHLVKLVAAGTEVYLEGSAVLSSERLVFRQNFKFKEVGEELYLLEAMSRNNFT